MLPEELNVCRKIWKVEMAQSGVRIPLLTEPKEFPIELFFKYQTLDGTSYNLSHRFHTRANKIRFQYITRALVLLVLIHEAVGAGHQFTH